MSRYQLSAPARLDLIEIRDFISRDSRIAARKVLAGIRAACRLLAKRPEIGHLRTDLVAEPLRFWPVYSYLIVYRPESEPIEIVRVLHGARDVSAII